MSLELNHIENLLGWKRLYAQDLGENVKLLWIEINVLTWQKLIETMPQ